MSKWLNTEHTILAVLKPGTAGSVIYVGLLNFMNVLSGNRHNKFLVPVVFFCSAGHASAMSAFIQIIVWFILLQTLKDEPL